MEFIESVFIEKPKEFVAEMYHKIRYTQEYNQTLIDVKSIEGTIGETNSVSELFFSHAPTEGQRERVIERTFPETFIFEMENEIAMTKTSVLFIGLDSRRTELKMKTEYAGMGGFLSFGMKGQKKFIRKQIQDSLHRVKAICEAVYN
ncbi:MAG: hypothetical protein C0592_06030 [Marinilabiliales bacterium]|nr:MAG: hypothetical protein C0592_06030 [Marinilabiliales bacterium]